MSKKIIVITGASGGFGLLTAEALAKAGHTVYASIRDTTGRNGPQVSRPWRGSPGRTMLNPTQDGADVAFGVIDRVRTEMLHRVGLDELLTPVKN